MASVGSFGVDTPTGNQISRTTTQTADVAVLHNALGQKLEGTTHGSEVVAENEVFVGVAIPAQTAVDAQNGASVILSDTINESATDYAKQTISTTTYPGAA